MSVQPLKIPPLGEGDPTDGTPNDSAFKNLTPVTTAWFETYKGNISEITGFQEAGRIQEKRKSQSRRLTSVSHLYSEHRCDICSKTFETKSGLVRHGFIHDNQRQFCCEFCGKGFNSGSTLISHRRRHIDDRPYQCRFCEQTFIESSNRTTHERTHTGERPYICEICHRTFTVRCSLVRHRRIHTNETPYICHLCSKSYRQYNGLKNHMANHHKMTNAVVKKTGTKREQCTNLTDRPHVCIICGRSFYQFSELWNHGCDVPPPDPKKTKSDEEMLTQCCVFPTPEIKPTITLDKEKNFPNQNDVFKCTKPDYHGSVASETHRVLKSGFQRNDAKPQQSRKKTRHIHTKPFQPSDTEYLKHSDTKRLQPNDAIPLHHSDAKPSKHSDTKCLQLSDARPLHHSDVKPSQHSDAKRLSSHPFLTDVRLQKDNVPEVATTGNKMSDVDEFVLLRSGMWLMS